MKLLAIWVAKLTLALTRLFRLGEGTALPGWIAEKIDPRFINKIAGRLKHGIVVITGTNGKTTTVKMLVEILYEEGYRVLHNPSGSNLTRGVASSLIQSVNFLGTNFKADIAVFEIDEATMPEAMTKLRPKIVLVTNLFRDQLDRYGELDKTAEIIGKSLRGFSDLLVLLNGDDPLVSSLFKYSEGKVKFFGLGDSLLNTKSKAALDSKHCLECGHELSYLNSYFGHLGDWQCPKCQSKRPSLNYYAYNLELKPEASGFNINLHGEETSVILNIPGLYNVYNALAASALGDALDCKKSTISHALKEFSSAFGRLEKFKKENKEITLLLIKNPTGANQALETIFLNKKEKNILLALNDYFADGTDVSWIWDIDFENLDLDNNLFICSGVRAEDMALRLKYAGVKISKIILEKDLERATKLLLLKTSTAKLSYILPTYTAMMEIRNFFDTKDNFANLGKVTKNGF